MPFGPGKYDDLATQVREQAHAHGVIVAVFNGKHGHGFSVQASAEVIASMTTILREIADQIDASIPHD